MTMSYTDAVALLTKLDTDASTAITKVDLSAALVAIRESGLHPGPAVIRGATKGLKRLYPKMPGIFLEDLGDDFRFTVDLTAK